MEQQSIVLDSAEVRVLGSLIEKEAATPDYYPLSLNALVNACNQKSNREPVVEYDEDTVYQAIDSLREKRFALTVVGGGRVNKYAQRISETLNLGRRELAVLCVLLLRGPQTLGEIKDRSERLYSFADLEETERVLEKLAEWPGISLAKKMPRQPGQKESRYSHLLSGEPAATTWAETVAPPATGKLVQLEQEVQQLRSDLDELKRRFDDLESQLK
ncbi:MAG TPA: YceH family protein [Bryobacteraceae bacterium]|nr:YceH family protein [Bryobacteraceae bacterium]